MSTTVRDVMSTHVVAVRMNASFKEIAAMLRAQRVSGFPVVDDDDKLIGVVSEADLLTKEAWGASPGISGEILAHREQAKADGIIAVDLMTKPPVTIGPDEPVTRAARLMYVRRVKRLPVITEDGQLIGIVARSDVLSVFSRPDEEIRREITDGVLLDGVRTDPARFTVTVKDGIATIEGTPETAATGRDLIDTARHVEGVVAIRDRLTYPPGE